VEILRRPDAEELGRSARARIVERYSWQRSVDAVEGLLSGRSVSIPAFMSAKSGPVPVAAEEAQ
jgi:hypothetical protein